MRLKQLDIKKILVWISVPLLSWGTLIAICVQACSNSSKTSQIQEQGVGYSQTKAQTFRLPTIPENLTKPGQWVRKP